MSKLAFLFPEEQMVKDAEEMIAERQLEIAVCKRVYTADAVDEARNALMNGAKVIVARGFQALLIREYTNTPLVEVKLTVQEVGLLIKRAKRLTGKKHPYIALIVFRNMVTDLSHIEELFNVRFRLFYIEKAMQALEVLEGVKNDRPDCIIGGNVAIKAAQEQGYMTLFYSSTRESVVEAVEAAVCLDQALTQRQQEEAQFETVLDASFNGIVRVNQDGIIIVVNHFIEDLVGMDNEAVKGQRLTEIFPQISMEQVEGILLGETNQITSSVTIRNKPMVIFMAPIEVDGCITGAIISMQKGQEIRIVSRKTEQDMRMRGFVTRQTFEMLSVKSKARREIVDLARIYAVSKSPVFMKLPSGESGMDLAKAIHNNSACRIGPFVSLDLGILSEEEQGAALFGSLEDGTEGDVRKEREVPGEGAMRLANHGTLYIRNAECLSKLMQRKIMRNILPMSEIRTDAQKMTCFDVRFIFSSQDDFRILMEEGRLIPDFFYATNHLLLQMPPIRLCPEDLYQLFDECIRLYSKQYHKSIHLTEGAYSCLLSFAWEGNNLQIRTFCERLVLTAKKRVVDEIVLKKLYEELYPQLKRVDGATRQIIYQSPEGEQICELLQKHFGNRKAVADQLGISTTTLWRRMKKYGIEK